jgi:hypothetical protein
MSFIALTNNLLYSAHILISSKPDKLYDELYSILYNYNIKNPNIVIGYISPNPNTRTNNIKHFIQPFLTGNLTITYDGYVICDTVKKIIAGELYHCIDSRGLYLNK